jgi:hypothetical protein
MNAIRCTLAAIAAALALCLTAGCGGGPSEAQCKQVLQQRFNHALTHPEAKPDDSTPAACKGLDAKTMERIVGQILYGK